jgi:leader peptidase (prepilin peptidase)/N-methyltransferase
MSAGRIWLVAGPVAAALAVGTFVHLGHGANAFAWAAVQVVLVALAAKDIEQRRLPNVITLPVSTAAILLRAGFERSDLVEVLVAGVVTFAVFYVLALLMRGGFGMGDVKLAAMLGFLLGSAAFPALVIGIAAGGMWAVALVIARKATLRSSIAYGPFLALGGAIAILFFNPPPLV